MIVIWRKVVYNMDLLLTLIECVLLTLNISTVQTCLFYIEPICSFFVYELCFVHFRQLKNLNLQLFLKDHLSQSHVLPCSHQRISSEDRMHTDSKRDSPPSANPGDILVLTARTEVPHLHLDQPVDVPIIVGWYQHDSRHSFSSCVGKATLDLKTYTDMLYFPEHISVTEHLETVQVCSI